MHMHLPPGLISARKKAGKRMNPTRCARCKRCPLSQWAVIGKVSRFQSFKVSKTARTRVAEILNLVLETLKP